MCTHGHQTKYRVDIEWLQKYLRDGREFFYARYLSQRLANSQKYTDMCRANLSVRPFMVMASLTLLIHHFLSMDF